MTQEASAPRVAPLTVKCVHNDGSEWIGQAVGVAYSASSKAVRIYTEKADPVEFDITERVIYVMNDRGSTIATYGRRAPPQPLDRNDERNWSKPSTGFPIE